MIGISEKSLVANRALDVGCEGNEQMTLMAAASCSPWRHLLNTDAQIDAADVMIV